MTTNFNQTGVQCHSKVSEVIEYGVYVVYDTVLQTYDLPVIIPTNKYYDYFNIIVNDVQSKYFNHEDDYILYRTGSYDVNTGIISNQPEQKINVLSYFINHSKRKLQTIIQTINYLPSGYFKMPAEQKQSIQDKIDDAIVKYVSDYVVPDMDFNVIKERLSKSDKSDEMSDTFQSLQ